MVFWNILQAAKSILTPWVYAFGYSRVCRHRLGFPFAAETQGRTLVVNLLLATILSACGNWIYPAYARHKITKVLRTETSEEAILQKLRQGGTSWMFFIVIVVLLAGVAGLIYKYPQYFQNG